LMTDGFLHFPVNRKRYGAQRLNLKHSISGDHRIAWFLSPAIYLINDLFGF